jgi:hypothetical protein
MNTKSMKIAYQKKDDWIKYAVYGSLRELGKNPFK